VHQWGAGKIALPAKPKIPSVLEGIFGFHWCRNINLCANLFPIAERLIFPRAERVVA
jgi:hypothetical protein